MTRSGPSDGGRYRAVLITILVLAAGIGVSAATRFPVFDDEANAIANSSADLSSILSRGLGRHRQFHPPLGEIVMHSWIGITGSMRPAVLRIPAIAFWIAALASLFWALAPIASAEACLAAVAAAALWPTHLLLPFSATWYSQAALLSVLSFGALLRAISAPSPTAARLAAVGAVAAIVAMAYTVFAWPFVVASELAAAGLIFGVGPLRRYARALVGVGVFLALAVSPTILAMIARVGPMLHRQAGGGPLQSIGAILGLLVGHSAPARVWIACFVILAVAGLVVGNIGADRRCWSILAAGLLSLGLLALTNTLNDKRLLLGSLFFPASLGLRIGERRGRIGLILCALAACPAWLAWAGVTHLPWLFPRWQDPVSEVASLHVSGPKPRLLITNEPAIAFSVAGMDGDRQLWQIPSDGPTKATSLRWWIGRPDQLVDAVDKQDRYTGIRLRTIDVILSPKMQIREVDICSAFRSAGWHVVVDQAFGMDPLSQFRHSGGRSVRFHLIRLSRDAAP